MADNLKGNLDDYSVTNAQSFATNAPVSLVNFQKYYGARVRNPDSTPLTNDIAPRRSEVYESLLFNNICGYISNCFPVATSIIDEQKWQQLCRDYFTEWRSHTPYFSQIPKTFIDFIEYKLAADSDYQQLPPWFTELIDYEWLELEVDTCNAVAINTYTHSDEQSFDTQAPLSTAPTLRLKQFQWPVHTISPVQIPEQEAPSFLLLYRNSEHKVEFMAVNAMTFALLEIISQANCSAKDAIAELATLTGNDPVQFEAFAIPLVAEFVANGLLVYSAAAR